MTIKTLFLGCISASMLLFTAPGMAAVVHECVAENPTAASSSWNFKGEANNIFEDIQSDAQQALDHADQLQSLARNPDMSWYSEGAQLEAIKEQVNDIESRICRLETIRPVVAPWQKTEIDRIAATTRLMVDNTEDALNFGNDHQLELWVHTYQSYANNLDNEARNLTNSVDHAVGYANVSKEYRNMQHQWQHPAVS